MKISAISRKKSKVLYIHIVKWNYVISERNWKLEVAYYIQGIYIDWKNYYLFKVQTMYQIFLHKFFSQLRLTMVVVELCNSNPKFTGPYLLKNRDKCGSTWSIYNLDNFTTYRINWMFPAVFPIRGRSSDGRALA